MIPNLSQQISTSTLPSIANIASGINDSFFDFCDDITISEHENSFLPSYEDIFDDIVVPKSCLDKIYDISDETTTEGVTQTNNPISVSGGLSPEPEQQSNIFNVVPQNLQDGETTLANKKKKKSNKSNVVLCEEAIAFRKAVYKIFTDNVKIDKRRLINFHISAQKNHPKEVKPILRDERRSIGLYFQNHYPEARTLIPFLKMEFDKNHDLIMSAAKSK